MTATTLNVKDFGAVGDGTDDREALQACFDTAFGGPTAREGSTVPHGVADAHLNRPVFFPSGKFRIESSLKLNDLYGASIFGSGIGSSVIDVATNVDGLVVNGMKDCVIRDLMISTRGNPTNVCFDLDWDGVGDVGLGNNLFQNFGAGSGGYESGSNIGLRIGHSGHEGHCNQFIKCGFGAGAQDGIGVLIEHGSGQLFQGGGFGGPRTIVCTGGSLHIDTVALASDSKTSFEISTREPCSIQGVRTEASDVFLKVTGGIVRIETTTSVPGVALIADMYSGASVSLDCVVSPGGIRAETGCKVFVCNCMLPDVNLVELDAAGVLRQDIAS